jgi:transposase
MPNRLYVAGEGELIRFTTANNMEAAKEKLGDAARTPNDDDCRHVWIVGQFHLLSSEELQEKYGVSRQAAANWRERGGPGLVTRREHSTKSKVAAMHQILTTQKRITAAQVAKQVHGSSRLVVELANQLGVSLAKGHRRMPEDADLVELQRGCTWQEFATKTGLRLSTLRNYIYARPELAKALKDVRKPTVTGPAAHGTFPKEKALAMHLKGMTPHKIAETLRVEQMTVRYWIRKWSQEASDDQSSDGREAGGAVGGSTARNKRKQ